MSIAFRAGATAAFNGISFPITKPTGVVSGDVMYAAFLQDAGSTPVLAGWTQLATVNTPTNSFPITLLRRVAGGAEGASYAFTAGASIGEGVIWAYSGVDNTTPEDATTTSGSGATGTITYPSITTATSNAVHLAIAADFNALASNPTGYTQRTSSASWLTDSDKSIASPSTVSGVTSTGDSEWVAFSVALRPAAGGGGSAALGGSALTSGVGSQLNSRTIGL